MKFFLSITTLFILVLLASCGKVPSETQKAQLEPMLFGCSMALNPSSLDDINPLNALNKLTMLGNFSDFTNKKWSLNDDETIVTASFSSDNTKFDCEFVKNLKAEWEIEKVRRNGEEVYDKTTANTKRAELNAEKKAVEEKDRLAEISKWREKGYSNANYKYYAKYPSNWNQGMWNSPELRIVCDPEYSRFQLSDSEFRMQGRADVEFQFKDSEGNVTKVLFDLTSSGNAGEAYDSYIGVDVRSTKEINAKAIKNMKASNSVEVDGLTFTVDDISQVPCI